MPQLSDLIAHNVPSARLLRKAKRLTQRIACFSISGNQLTLSLKQNFLSWFGYMAGRLSSVQVRKPRSQGSNLRNGM
uniref:Uncharacterized protein n=1 Tax=Aquisalinus luteolus TaxID=1566827 RepID=A0A8J3A103_9PROT|nr:hypothetical protein GCM10011355_09320 [Aquisalinus luteolus]